MLVFSMDGYVSNRVLCILLTSCAGFVYCSPYIDTFNYGAYAEWKPCYKNCSCFEQHQGFVKVDCSDRRLERVPYLPPTVIWLNLRKNLIKSLSFNSDNDESEHPNRQPFDGLRNLQYLDISSNSLENVDPGVFKPLISLVSFNMKNNSVKLGENWEKVKKVLNSLKSLEELRIDGIGNVSFAEGCPGLSNLSLLDMSGLTGICEIKIIQRDFFLNTPFLKHLDISSCKIQHIEEGAFGFLTKLETLHISYNKELGFASLPNITYNMTHTSIKRLYLHNINCLTGIGKELLTHHVVNLKETHLQELVLSRNRLELLERGLIGCLPGTLQKLSLAENKLLLGPYLMDFVNFHSLKIFNMSLRFEPPVYETAVFEVCSENEDDINAQNTTLLRQNIVDDNFSKFLRYFGNPSFTVESKWKPVFFIYLPGNFETIYANASRLYSSLNTFGLIAPKLKHMFFQDNLLYEWKGTIYGIQNVTHIDLSNNFCTKMSSDFFLHATGLLHLNMSRNSIGDNLESDWNGLIFRKLVSLEILDISFNSIFDMPHLLFIKSRNIKILVLNNNQLSDWNVHVRHMVYLQHLDLSKNRIDSIRDSMREELSFLMMTKNTSIDLSDNNVDCSCTNLPYIEWMVKHKANLKRFGDYECAIKSKNIFNFRDPKTSLETLAKECASYTIYYIIVSISLTTVIFVSIAVVVKRNIWTIRFTIYQMKQNLKRGGQYMQILYQRKRSDYAFDVFISYSARDRGFVINDLDEKLKELNLRTCIRERDFLPGWDKVDNIMNAIEISRKTVCVVSKSYLQSGWRDYELNMAKIEGIKNRGGLGHLFVIILPDTFDVDKKCPNSLKDLIREDYFLRFPYSTTEESNKIELEEEIKRFWNKFSEAILNGTNNT
ncbi:toll-like receptor 4 [Ostrea edulis]|uniref:toll-like receptor 4 n=1 Tax=Ostrea edulis TaxID=37623 RepID=UPI0024AF6772|nr:toll-like receptor 4 [Ostrea edulis]